MLQGTLFNIFMIYSEKLRIYVHILSFLNTEMTPISYIYNVRYMFALKLLILKSVLDFEIIFLSSKLAHLSVNINFYPSTCLLHLKPPIFQNNMRWNLAHVRMYLFHTSS